ncbi:hypothetical protein FACS189481_4660 [Clostridia bacterium]|nr:hypothetical protein FACS189481_4660 [Clostridia bacterium]
MNFKKKKRAKRFQKVLCMILAVASVSSMITPASHAAPKWVELADGYREAVVNFSDAEDGNQEKDKPNEFFKNSQLINKVIKANREKEGVNMRQMRAFDLTCDDNPNYHKILVAYFGAGEPIEDAAKAATKHEWHKLQRLGYNNREVVPPHPDLAAPTGMQERLPLTHVVFSTKPIKVRSKYQVDNGLIGMNRDIVLKLLKLMSNSQNVRAMVAMAQRIYDWAMVYRAGFLARFNRPFDLNDLLDLYMKSMAEFFDLPLVNQTSSPEAEKLLKKIMVCILRVLEDTLNKSPNTSEVAAWKATLKSWKASHTTIRANDFRLLWGALLATDNPYPFRRGSLWLVCDYFDRGFNTACDYDPLTIQKAEFMEFLDPLTEEVSQLERVGRTLVATAVPLSWHLQRLRMRRVSAFLQNQQVSSAGGAKALPLYVVIPGCFGARRASATARETYVIGCKAIAPADLEREWLRTQQDIGGTLSFWQVKLLARGDAFLLCPPEDESTSCLVGGVVCTHQDVRWLGPFQGSGEAAAALGFVPKGGAWSRNVFSLFDRFLREENDTWYSWPVDDYE